MSWISNRYEGWEITWTSAGAVPREIESIIGSEFSPELHSRITKAADMCAKTAETIWRERNADNEAWIDSIPELRERKTKASRKQWKYVSQKRGKITRKKTRVQQKKADREEHRRTMRGKVVEAITEWQVETNEWREGKRLLRVSEEEVDTEAKRLRKAADKDVIAAHRDIIKRAKYAGSTLDIDTSGTNTTEMVNTTPMTSGKRTRGTRAHFWIPKSRTSVRVSWAGTEGNAKHNKVKGTWYPATTTTMEWPEDKGIPGIYLKYEDGTEEWAAMDLFGDTIERITPITQGALLEKKKRKRKHLIIEHTERFPPETTEWLGYGAKLEVKFRGKWCAGEVIEQQRGGILVQYSDGVCLHEWEGERALHTRGCRIKVFKKNGDKDEVYKRSPWLECPFGGREEVCECWPCRKTK